MGTYITWNGAAPTTAATVKVTTGTAAKTMLQVAPSSGNPVIVLEWGISFDGSTAAAPIACELLTSTAAATVTAATAANVVPYLRSADVGAASVTLGTTATGYTSSSEGTPAGVRIGDLQLVSPTNQYVKQYPLGREFFVPALTFLRVRVTAAAAVSCYCYVIFQDM